MALIFQAEARKALDTAVKPPPISQRPQGQQPRPSKQPTLTTKSANSPDPFMIADVFGTKGMYGQLAFIQPSTLNIYKHAIEGLAGPELMTGSLSTEPGALSILAALMIPLTTPQEAAWEDFMRKLTTPLAGDVRSLWSRLRTVAPSIPLPQAGSIDDDLFQFVWNVGRHHFTIDLVGEQRAEWFYLDRETKRKSGGEFRIDRRVLPAAMIGPLTYVSSSVR